MDSSNFEVGAWAMVHYIYNTSGDKFAVDLFPDAHPNYQDEKSTLWAKSPTRAIGKLDGEHLRKLFAIVRERYEFEAMRQLRTLR